MKNMGENPLVSIIVPVYNVERYLPQCLDSVVNQTYKNIEVICVNDGSPDNSIKILEDYSAKDPRIKVVSQKNQGLSGARNTGIKYASGKFIMFVDSDDWIDLDTCQLAVNAAETNDADFVFWSYVREFENGSKEKLMFWDDGTVFDEKAVKSQLHRRLCGLQGEELSHPEYANAIETAWAKLYLASEIKNNDVKFVDTKEIGTEDALFNLYALGYVKKGYYIRKCLNHYRKTNSDSLTSNYRSRLYICWQKLFDLMQEYITENKLAKEYEDALYNRIALSILGLGLNILSSDLSAKKKKVMIKEIITSDRYKEAYKKLEFKYFPLHWKIFYAFAKAGNATGVYSLLKIIRRIIG